MKYERRLRRRPSVRELRMLVLRACRFSLRQVFLKSFPVGPSTKVRFIRTDHLSSHHLLYLGLLEFADVNHGPKKPGIFSVKPKLLMSFRWPGRGKCRASKCAQLRTCAARVAAETKIRAVTGRRVTESLNFASKWSERGK